MHALRGPGTVSDIDLTQLYDDSKSLSEDPFTIPTYTGGGWVVRVIAESGFFDKEKPIREYTKKERHDFLYREPVKVKINGVNLTYEGLIPKLQKSFLSKDRESMQPHIRAFVDRAVTFTRCPECDGTRLSELARSSKIGEVNIADACAMEIRDLAEWAGDSTSRRWRRCSPSSGTPSTRSWRSASATSRSTGPRARSPAARRSAPR